MLAKVLLREPSLLLGRGLERRALSNVTLRQYHVEPIINETVSLVKIRGLEVRSNAIDELMEEYNQERNTEELMELHCVPQQEVMEESLSEEEEVKAKQKFPRTIRIEECCKYGKLLHRTWRSINLIRQWQ
ncbi:hypothetical protein AVEN_201371-1 [Araneus ventricosus]|uniref:Uncharacterized protein n=1 Tax=Araneus ventricosus TaxID=182803 RepID=A0A4Y2CPW1_ARAVE|nr:hypothetical protein AVEN_186651-1 [Araneus ventricosus]GBM05944.1 hypothetical protein AVEN_201371-1 [Araneus ventricosus]